MPRLKRVLLRTLLALMAFMLMLGLLLYIAYSYNIYTPPAEKGPPLMAITGATVIDGTGGPLWNNATIIIGGDKILSIESDGQVPKGAHILAAKGRFVLPGLIDAAVFMEAPAGQETNYLSGEWAWEITRGLPHHRRNALDAGITTLLDVGSGLDSILRTRSLLEQEQLAGPRLWAAGPILKAPGGYPGKLLFPHRLDEATHSIQTPTEATQWVQEFAGRDVDVISVSFTSLGARFPRLDVELLTTIIQEAHIYGRPVIVHPSSLAEAKAATAAGADALLGGVTLSGEQVDGDLLSLMAEQGTVYIPTLAAVESRQALWPGTASLGTAQILARVVHQAGIPLLAGSGTAGADMDYGQSLQTELNWLVDAGLEPVEALQAATLNTARFLGLEHDLGKLEKNALANLLIVEHNPLEDIRALERTQLIIQNGVIVANYLAEP